MAIAIDIGALCPYVQIIGSNQPEGDQIMFEVFFILAQLLITVWMITMVTILVIREWNTVKVIVKEAAGELPIRIIAGFWAVGTVIYILEAIVK